MAVGLVALALVAWSASARADSGFDAAIEAAMPRVVKLYGAGVGLSAGYGSGIVVSGDGLVVTVLSLLVDARTIRATLEDGTRLEADLLYRDTARQLAWLKLHLPIETDMRGEPIETDTPALSLPHFDLTKEASLAPGDWVLAVGNAFKVADGAEPLSIAHGVFGTRTRLDATRRAKDFPYRGDVLVLDAITSNPGAPGSAVVNLDGELVGMIGRIVVSTLTHTHFNYAMPRDVLLASMADMEADAARRAAGEPPIEPSPRDAATGPTSADLGIKIAKTGYLKVFASVERVRRGSPAAAAGVKVDDLILSVNGRSVADVEQYEKALAMIEPGAAVELVLQRGQEIVSVRMEQATR
jgi:serine protease Do